MLVYKSGTKIPNGKANNITMNAGTIASSKFPLILC